MLTDLLRRFVVCYPAVLYFSSFPLTALFLFKKEEGGCVTFGDRGSLLIDS